MALKRNLYRLTGLDGSPHHVLDAPYESIDAAVVAAKSWCDGQGLTCKISDSTRKSIRIMKIMFNQS